MSADRQRIEEARAAILASGDRDLINRLHLLDAAKGSAPLAPGRDGGPSLLGTGLAVAGGMVLGNMLAGMTLSRELEAAFATLAADAGLAPEALGLGAGAEEAGHLAAAELPAEDDFLGDLGLDDFFDI